MITNKLIVIEGSDGSGKKTQSDILTSRLMQYTPTTKMSFPDYEGPFGKEVRRYLNGEFGNVGFFDSIQEAINQLQPGKVSPCWGMLRVIAALGKVNHIELASLLYAADRAVNLPKLKEALNNGVVVCDRYDISNWAHQGAKLEGQERENLILWLKRLEREQVGLPVPDLVVYLNLPPEKAREAMEKSRRKLDMHEQDLDYLIKVNNLYLELAKEEGWHIIECLNGNGRKSPEEAAEEIWKKVKFVLGI